MDRIEVHKIVHFLMLQIREEQRARLEAITGKTVRFAEAVSALDVENKIEEILAHVRGTDKAIH